MHKYKIVNWCAGNKLVCEIEAISYEEARYLFYINNTCDDMVSIDLVDDLEEV